jgi:hypothetical protein
MELSVDNLLETARQEGSREVRADHARSNGWYSSEAIANAITTVSMRNAGRVEYCMRLQPLYITPFDIIHTCVGAIVNIDAPSACCMLHKGWRPCVWADMWCVYRS